MNSQQNVVSNARKITLGNNETGNIYWVGTNNGINFYGGQTFKSPGNGVLKHISLFPSLILGRPEMQLDLYEFDETTHTWKTKKAESKNIITKSQEGQWFNFILDNATLSANTHYAFKLNSNGGMIAVAETPWLLKNNIGLYGEQWTASSAFEQGKFHRDFSFAYQAEIVLQ